MTELNQESQNKMYFSENSSSNSSEENVVYAVDLQCLSPNPSGAVDVPVYPGSTLTGYANCIVTNPHSVVVRIQIQVSADGLVSAAPGDNYTCSERRVSIPNYRKSRPKDDDVF